MARGEVGPSVTTLRRAASRAVDASSLRAVAKSLGMSPSGLQKFLDGARPREATRRKLQLWYAREGSGQVSTVAAIAALDVLVADLPPDARPQAIKAVLAALSAVDSGRCLEWLPGLQSEGP